MYQKLIIAVMFLGLASCSAPKKATYVKPVISAKILNIDNCKETLSKARVEHVEIALRDRDVQK